MLHSGRRPAQPGEPMNSTQGTREEVVRLVRAYTVNGIEGALHGATFDGRRLVLAAGDRLVRLSPDSGRFIDQLRRSQLEGSSRTTAGTSGSAARARSRSSTRERATCCGPSRPG